MADKLRQFLLDRSMTQRELATTLGMSEEYISRLLNEKTPVTDSFKWKFSGAFGHEVAADILGNGQAQPE